MVFSFSFLSSFSFSSSFVSSRNPVRLSSIGAGAQRVRCCVSTASSEEYAPITSKNLHRQEGTGKATEASRRERKKGTAIACVGARRKRGSFGETQQARNGRASEGEKGCPKTVLERTISCRYDEEREERRGAWELYGGRRAGGRA
jgi:hypothetical protein